MTTTATRRPFELLPPVARLLAAQHGLATRAQLVARGAHPSAIDRALRAGRFRAVADGVYALPTSPDTGDRRLLTAVLAVGPEAVASHDAAAWVHRLRGFDAFALEVTSPEPRRARGVTVHRMDLDRRDRETVRGIPVTRPARTFIDLRGADLALLEPALEDALRRRLVTVDLLARLLAQRGIRGRHGAGHLGRLLEVRGPSYRPTESELEDLFEPLLKQANVPLPGRQFNLVRPDGSFVARLDFAYAAERIGIWLDGYMCHQGVTAFQRDHFQSQEAAKLGWRTVRFTWHDLTQRGEHVVETVKALRAQSPPSARGEFFT
jgi:very-short-patch-repair endonuclease